MSWLTATEYLYHNVVLLSSSMTCHPRRNTPGAIFGAGTTKSSEAHDFDPVFFISVNVAQSFPFV